MINGYSKKKKTEDTDMGKMTSAVVTDFVICQIIVYCPALL